jgi:hypothetical protein
MSNDVNELMKVAHQQLFEHAQWLNQEIMKIPSFIESDGMKILLAEQALQIKIRMVKSDRGIASVVYEYPDELAAYLQNPATPKHLRDSLAGGHQVSQDQPTFTATREP